MQLYSIRRDEFAALPARTDDQLGPGVTVFHGPAHSGKSSTVRLVRDLLGQMAGAGSPSGNWAVNGSEPVPDGEIRVHTGAGMRCVRRRCLPGNDIRYAISDDDGRGIASTDNGLRQFGLTPGELGSVVAGDRDGTATLSHLMSVCHRISGFASQSRNAAADGRGMAEQALLLTIRDRDGNGVDGGVVHRISELRRRQGELQSSISVLRRPSADIAARIEQLVREIDELTASIDRMDVRIREVDAEILRLEQLLEDLRRRNVLSLDRGPLEAELAALTASRDRWKEIRTQIAREQQAVRLKTAAATHPRDLLTTLRALIGRLEERTDGPLKSAGATSLPETHPLAGDVQSGHFRSELAALCEYFRNHEAGVVQHLESLQSSLAERAHADALRMEQLLDEQMTAIRAELQRSGNVLVPSAAVQHTNGCRFSGHAEWSNRRPAVMSDHRTIEDVELAIRRLRDERARSFDERNAWETSRAAKRNHLERLRLESTGTATLEQLDSLRAGIAELDAEVALLEEQRRLLDRTEVALKEVCDRLRVPRVPRVLELANQYVSRLTDSEFRCFTLLDAGRMQIQSARGVESLPLAHAGHSTSDAIVLALRLAIARVLAEQGMSIPVLIDDLNLFGEETRSAATAELLLELSREGQQILVFTSSPAVRDWYRARSVDIRELAARVEVPVAPAPIPVIPAPIMTSPVVLHAWTEPTVEVRLPEPVVISPPPVAPPVIVEQTPVPTGTNWLFYLEVDHGVEDLSGITLGELEALRSSGILLIEDLLVRSVPELEELTRRSGFSVNVERLQSLRGQAELTTRVPMLRRGDAALLYASGIRSAEELSRLRPETVYDRVTEFQRSDVGSRFRRGGRLVDRQQAINWARFGQFTRTLEEARHGRSRFSMRPQHTRPVATSSTHAVPEQRVTGTAAAPAVSGNQTAVRRRRRRSDDLESDERRRRRETRRRRLAARLRTEGSSENSSLPEEAERIGGLRFFLSRTSPIERAPSIGPRTSQLLESIGVRTVEEFLSLPAERIADKLSHRRMTAQIVQQWQAQSRLMCQIPELRGHDAQILVACGITTPEALAAQKAADLFSVVEPFSRTRDGERIIRNGRRPDLAEVTDWIQWAANARSMRAA